MDAMANAWKAWLLLSLTWICWLVGAQQFKMFQLPYEVMGPGPECVKVLNTTVSCDFILGRSTTL
jgi:hypothetical protein